MSTNFQIAQQFAAHMNRRAAGGRKLFLAYDDYRSHTTEGVLQFFASKNIVIYDLPPHAFGKAQPLDVGVLEMFKRLNNHII